MKLIDYQIIGLFGLLLLEWVIPHPYPLNTNMLVLLVGIFILTELQGKINKE